MARWWYCVRGNLTILQDSWRLANAEVREGRANLRGRFLLHTAVVTALSIALLVANPWAFLWMMLVPNVLIGLGVWWISYKSPPRSSAQHPRRWRPYPPGPPVDLLTLASGAPRRHIMRARR